MTVCYYHRDYENKDIQLAEGHLPYGFCNEEEYELWADKTYGKKGSKNKSKSIEEMQEQMRVWGKEAKERELDRKNGGQRSII